jgi:hypothetical protein
VPSPTRRSSRSPSCWPTGTRRRGAACGCSVPTSSCPPTACCTAGTGASGRRRRSATTCPRRCCRSRSAASTSAPPSRGRSGRRWPGSLATPVGPGCSSPSTARWTSRSTSARSGS